MVVHTGLDFHWKLVQLPPELLFKSTMFGDLDTVSPVLLLWKLICKNIS